MVDDNDLPDDAGLPPNRSRTAIRRVKENHGLSVKGWARKAGLGSPNTLRNFLRGRSENLNGKTLTKLAEAIGVSVSVLTGEQPDPLDELNKAGLDMPTADQIVRLLKAILEGQQTTNAKLDELLAGGRRAPKLDRKPTKPRPQTRQ